MLEELFHFHDREWIYKLGEHHRIKIEVDTVTQSIDEDRRMQITIWIWGESGWGKLLWKWEDPPKDGDTMTCKQLEEHARDRCVEYAIRFIDG